MELRQDGYSSGLCLDFDQACAEFWKFVTTSREQQVKATMTAEDKLGKNQTWKPKYKSDQQILRAYYASDFVAPLDPVLQSMSPAELDALMDTWDPYEDPPA